MIDLKPIDSTTNGKCSGCGSCCSNILPLTMEEVRQIKAYIKQHNIKEQRNNVLMGVDMSCPFRDERNKKCLIYSIRPAICREFMCNYTQSWSRQITNHEHYDIKSAEFDFKKFYVVLMRSEFFESND